MFARDKRIGPYTYVYLVENVREEGRTKQRIIANLGRKEVVVARGDLPRRIKQRYSGSYETGSSDRRSA